jgi:hypothetical protein
MIQKTYFKYEQNENTTIPYIRRRQAGEVNLKKIQWLFIHGTQKRSMLLNYRFLWCRMCVCVRDVNRKNLKIIFEFAAFEMYRTEGIFKLLKALFV